MIIRENVTQSKDRGKLTKVEVAERRDEVEGEIEEERGMSGDINQ